MCEECQSLQDEELKVLSAIFDDDWHIEDINTFSINILNSAGSKVYFQVTLPPTYPLYSPPTYQISAPWMSGEEKKKLYHEMECKYSEHIGETVIYIWIDVIRAFIENCKVQQRNEINKGFITDKRIQDGHLIVESPSLEKDIECDELPIIEHGEPIQDRKSVFQAHVARIVCEKQVKQVLSALKENRKIAGATHNIYAYRISCPGKNTYIYDCDDDGETKAGSGLMHLLQILDVTDVLVVVTRWYGGIHLGADRFKHINNTARILLSKLGFVKSEKGETSKTKR